MDRGYWETRYSESKTGWDRGIVHPALTRWVDESFSLPSRILVPGCGRGHEVLYLAEHGFEVTAIDFADEPIQVLKANLANANLSANLIQADLFDWDPKTQFDVIHEQTCLCAIDPSRRKEYEGLLRSWLRPEGFLSVLFMQTQDPTNGPPFHCDLQQMKSLFSPSHWKWPNADPIRYDHPSGGIYEFGFLLRRLN